MNSKCTSRFWQLYHKLPETIRILAFKNFKIWKEDSRHPSLHFKQVTSRLWSIRIGLHYRALAQGQDDEFEWVWIGTHAEYDRLLK